MANVKAVKSKVRAGLEAEAKEQTQNKGFQSGEFVIDSDDWDKLVKNLGCEKLKDNCYQVSLPSYITVGIQPGYGVAIGAVSGTLAGGATGGGVGAGIGALVGFVFPGIGNIFGAGVGGLIGAGVGSVVGLAGGGGGGALIGKAVKKYGQKFDISAEDILSNFSDSYTEDNIVYAEIRT